MDDKIAQLKRAIIAENLENPTNLEKLASLIRRSHEFQKKFKNIQEATDKAVAFLRKHLPFNYSVYTKNYFSMGVFKFYAITDEFKCISIAASDYEDGDRLDELTQDWDFLKSPKELKDFPDWGVLDISFAWRVLDLSNEEGFGSYKCLVSIEDCYDHGYSW